MPEKRRTRVDLHERTDHHGALAAVVRARRAELTLRQDELADLAGCSVRFVHVLESGKPTVQLDKVLAVLEVLGLHLSLERGVHHDGITIGPGVVAADSPDHTSER